MSNDLLGNLLGETATGTNEMPNSGREAAGNLHDTNEKTIDVGDGSSLTEEELMALEESTLKHYAYAQQQLAEQMNIVRLNKQAQLSNLTARSALILARRANDNLWKQYSKFNALRIKLRSEIMKKYGSRAAAYARNIMTSAASAAGLK